jgi:hypothetical protein
MAKATGHGDIWNSIREDSNKGNFLPILGFDLAAVPLLVEEHEPACRPDACANETSFESFQYAERKALVNALWELDVMARRLPEFYEKVLGFGEWGVSDAERAREGERVANYIASLRDRLALNVGSDYESYDDVHITVESYRGTYARFRLSLAFLAAHSTTAWAEALGRKPGPVGAEFDTTPQVLSGNRLETVQASLRRALDLCSELRKAPVADVRPASGVAGPSPDARDVFISCAGEDTEIGLKIESYLQTLGVTSWFYKDPKSNPMGDDYEDRVIAAIKNCRVFLVVLSKHYLSQDNCRFELSISDFGKRFPVGVESIDENDYPEASEQRKALAKFGKKSWGFAGSDSLDDVTGAACATIAKKLNGQIDGTASGQSSAGATLPVPKLLRVDSIYYKLLRLSAEVFGSNPQSFWDIDNGPAFHARHQAIIKDFFNKGDFRTGWVPGSDGPTPNKDAVDTRGMKLLHLIWLESLLREVCLCPTRAYRTRDEFAYALSLARSQFADMPTVTGDLYELGLICDPLDEKMREPIQEILRYSSWMDDECQVRRPVSHLHNALVQLLMTSDDDERIPTKGGSDFEVAPVKRTPLVLSMGFDLEMERAFDDRGVGYRVVIPVMYRLASKDETGREMKKDWIVGAFSPAEDGKTDGAHQVEWTTLEKVNKGSDGPCANGPMIIKLFGSPLHPLPSAKEIEFPGIDADTVLQHALVLDERLIIDFLVEMSNPNVFAVIADLLAKRNLYFLGQSADTWGERAPLYLVGALQSWQAADRGQVHFVGKKPGVFGMGTFDRLNFEDYTQPQEFPGIVLRTIVARAFGADGL